MALLTPAPLLKYYIVEVCGVESRQYRTKLLPPILFFQNIWIFKSLTPRIPPVSRTYRYSQLLNFNIQWVTVISLLIICKGSAEPSRDGVVTSCVVAPTTKGCFQPLHVWVVGGWQKYHIVNYWFSFILAEMCSGGDAVSAYFSKASFPEDRLKHEDRWHSAESNTLSSLFQEDSNDFSTFHYSKNVIVEHENLWQISEN